MNSNEHDRLATRLASILIKLNMGERLDIDRLAEEFNVNRRTIHRDMTERLSFLPIDKTDGLYALDPVYFGKVTFQDIKRFAGLAGVAGLFPSLDTQFLRELFDARLQETLSIHGLSFEENPPRLDNFRLLQRAINEHRMVSFGYAKEQSTKLVEAEPYRLISHLGVWYLAAVNDGKPKAYALGKMAAINVLAATFSPDASVQKMLDDEDSIWLNEKKTEVVLTIAPAAAIYFRRRKLISQQVIEKELEDGGLIVSGKFAHPNQILPIVRYWLPHVRIVSPSTWQEELEIEIKAYLNE